MSGRIPGRESLDVPQQRTPSGFLPDSLRDPPDRDATRLGDQRSRFRQVVDADAQRQPG